MIVCAHIVDVDASETHAHVFEKNIGMGRKSFYKVGPYQFDMELQPL